MKYILFILLVGGIVGFSVDNKAMKYYACHVHVINDKKLIESTIVWVVKAANRDRAKRLFNDGVLETYPHSDWRWELHTYMVYEIFFDDDGYPYNQNANKSLSRQLTH